MQPIGGTPSFRPAIKSVDDQPATVLSGDKPVAEVASPSEGSGAAAERALDADLQKMRLSFSAAFLPAGATAIANAATAPPPANVFDEETAKKVSDKYASDDVRPMSGGNARGGCMNAVYEGLGQLFDGAYAGDLRKRVYKESVRLEKLDNARRAEKGEGPGAEGRYNSIDLVWKVLQKDGKAEAPSEFKHKSGAWDPPVEQTLLDSLKDKPDGWYFFGVSVSDGYHSVMLAADKTQDPPKLYWLDQFSEGFDSRSGSYATSTTDVTGSLDQVLSNVGHGKTRVWPLIPDSASK